MPQLLAARDVQLDAEEAATTAEQAAAEPAERPSCAICLEPYSVAGSIVPRMLPCGHAFCEACLARKLRCVAPTMRARSGRRSQVDYCAHNGLGLVGKPLLASGAGKRLECPTCWKECAVKDGRAAELPVVYDMQGP